MITPVTRGTLAHVVAYLAVAAMLTETRHELDAVRAVVKQLPPGRRALVEGDGGVTVAQLDFFLQNTTARACTRDHLAPR